MQAVTRSGQPEQPSGAHWYLVQCRPGQTERACRHLENQGYHCYLPYMTMERVRGGRRIQREEPLFPGYLFIQLDLDGQSAYSIRSTRGVRKLVQFGDRATPVPDEVIEGLRARLGDTGGEDVRPAFEQGEPLRIRQGPFADLEAAFERFDGEERVIVLLNFMQKQHRLTLNLGDVTRQ